MGAHARNTDPTESHDAINDHDARLIVEAVTFLYTLGPARDEQIVERYFDLKDGHPSWPNCRPESVRKRCSDARKLDVRLQHIRSERGSAGRSAGVYGYVETAA